MSTDTEMGYLRLRHDPNLQRELDTIKRKVISTNESANRWRWIISAFVLAATVFSLHYLEVPDGVMVSATLAVSAVLLITFVNRGFSDLHATMIIQITIVEWIGRKQLGEVENVH